MNSTSESSEAASEAAEAPVASFANLGLAEPILKAVIDAGYTVPTPIQSMAIPLIMAGNDLMGGAQTGTGKTAAFTLPILNRILKHASSSTSPARHATRALILTPTRELAMQVEESVQTYSKHSGLRSTVVFGGVAIEPQIQILRRGVEILVATPGRLLDLQQQKALNLQQVEVFVLDEADRMLDMGFIPDVKRIISLLPAKRQNLLFSATFPDDIKRLCESLLHNPERVQIARKNAVAESVSHVMHPVSRERKRDLLIHLIKVRNMHQVLVFTATRLGCNRLAYQLNKDGVHAAAIHGDKSQSERIEALDAFKAGKVAILVATDVAARGLDIAELPSVVNFDLPNTPEDYVHRIGRTGRAGNTGEAISLVCPEEQEKLTEIEKMIKTRIRSEVITGYEPGARDAAPSFEPPRRNREQGDQRGPREPREPRDSHQRGRGARPERGEPVKSGERERTTPSQGPAPRARAPKAPSDPIFTKPYEPTEQREGVLSAPPTSPPRPQRQVAALLGGMARKRD